MSINNRNFLIIDFNAGNVITHHLNYVLTYALFLKNEGKRVRIIIPKYAPDLEPNYSYLSVEKTLVSRFYRMTNSYWLLFSINSVLLKIIGQFGVRLTNWIDELRDKLNVNRAFRYLSKNISKAEENEILFPTVDLYSLKLLKNLLKTDIGIDHFFLRINTLGEFNIKNHRTIIDYLEEIVKLYPAKVTIGCESLTILQNLQNRLTDFYDLHFTPLPSIFRGEAIQYDETYGFLGGAKKRKGFCEIPKISTQIKKVSPNAKILVQQSPFKWQGYNSVIFELQTMNYIKLLNPILSNDEFFDALSNCNFVVLPYDKDSYLSSGSSLFYYASDFLIPTITLKGLEFTSDIIDFQSGIIVSDMNDFSNHDFGIENWKKIRSNLGKYNLFRNTKNRDFLRIQRAN